MRNTSNQMVREEPDSNWIPPTTFRVAESFEEFVALNPDLMVEQNSNGEIVIMQPVGSEGSNREIEISCQLQNWCRENGGISFSASVLFKFPDGSKRGPDASWITMERWEALPKEDREGFAPICPDFVIELRSQSDRISNLNKKMLDYIANGVRLGWLIDPFERRVYVYRPSQQVETLSDPVSLSGESVLPGFVLDLQLIWAS